MFTRQLQLNVNKMIKQSISAFILASLLLLVSCVSNKKTSLEAFNQDIYTPEYASGFKILGADNVQSTLIQVFNPWQGAKDVEMSYFISRNGEQAPAGFTGPTIPAGAKQIVCMSSSYICLLYTSLFHLAVHESRMPSSA